MSGHRYAILAIARRCAAALPLALLLAAHGAQANFMGDVTDSHPPENAATAENAEITLVTDVARIIRFSKPADTIIIGNPAIADITLLNSESAVVTGRSFGTTNLMVLAADGDVVVNASLTVSANETGKVTVQRKKSRSTLHCTDRCVPTLAVGDESDAFDAASSQALQNDSRGFMGLSGATNSNLR